MPYDKESLREKLVRKLDAIIDSPETRTSDVLKAIEVVGREYGLFTEKKQVNIDVNTIVKHFSDRQLEILSREDRALPDYIDIQPWSNVDTDSGTPGEGGGTGKADPGDKGSPASGEPGVDKGKPAKNRKKAGE